MDFTNFLGLVAGTFTTIAFVPQVVRTWRTRSTHDISLWMFALMCAGQLLWLIYGMGIRSWPVIAANVSALALSLAILFLKIRNK